jgi:hypothetical protein
LRGLADDAKYLTDLGDTILGNADLQQDARRRCRDLGVDFVGAHLDNRLIGRDPFADSLQPSGDGSFCDAFTQSRQSDLGRHQSGLLYRNDTCRPSLSPDAGWSVRRR